MGLLSPFLQRQRIAQAVPHIQGTVLDFGCGNGALAAHIHPTMYIGYDPNPKALAAAQDAWPRHTFTEQIPDGRYDTIAALAVLEHLDDAEADVKALASMTGRIVATTPHPKYEWVHDMTAHIGLASIEANHEHTELLDEPKLRQIGDAAGLETVLYKRFLWGMNQLVIWRT